MLVLRDELLRCPRITRRGAFAHARPLGISRVVDLEFLEHLLREKLDQPELPGEP